MENAMLPTYLVIAWLGLVPPQDICDKNFLTAQTFANSLPEGSPLREETENRAQIWFRLKHIYCKTNAPTIHHKLELLWTAFDFVGECKSINEPRINGIWPAPIPITGDKK